MSAIRSASTNVTDRHPHIGTKKYIAKPERIYVYPFAPTHAAIPSCSTAAEKLGNPATTNLTGLIVMGTTKVEGEMSGRTKIEGAAKRTAAAIGRELRIRIREEGLIK
jgi:hypothetical protein